MSLPYWVEREQLTALERARQEGVITVGYIGGSITDARSRSNWPQYVSKWLAERLPSVRIRIENAAIGATCSDLAVFRAKRDLLDRGCQLIFVEFAVNDSEMIPIKRTRTREGLLRILLAGGAENIVLVYTHSEDMLEDMINERYPSTIAEFEQLAEYYNLSSIWVGKYAYDQVQAGVMSMEQWLPDGLHPSKSGSQLYADCIARFIEQQLQQLHANPSLPTLPILLPIPLNTLCWEKVSELPFSSIQTSGIWIEQRWHDYEWIDTILETDQIGASLSFQFEGRGLMLVFDFGKLSAEFSYSIDGAPWQLSNRDCPDWVNDSGWYRLYDFGHGLSDGAHTFELVVQAKSNNNPGEYFRLGKVGIIS